MSAHAPTVLIAAFLSLSAAAEEPPAAPPTPPTAGCTTPEHRQFDFWVGEWNVSADGEVAGVNRIEKMLGGCALLESWTGGNGYRGHSLNFYDAPRKMWHQTWVDSAGGVLYLDGKFADGRMVMTGTRTNPAGKRTDHRITWTPLAGGGLRQLWEASTDGGKEWKVLFDGVYSPKT